MAQHDALQQAQQRIAELEAELQQTRMAWQEDREHLRLLICCSPDFIFFQDTALRYVWAPRTFPSFTPAEILGKTDIEVAPTKVAEQLMAIKRQVLATGETARKVFTLTIGAKDFDFYHVMQPLLDQQGHIVGVATYLHDVTEERRVEQALRTSEARYRQLLDASIIGIIVVNLSGDIIEANQTFLNMMGYSEDDLTTGKIRWTEMTPPEYREQDARAIEQVLATGIASPFEKEYIRKDGERIPVIIGGVWLEGTEPPAVLTFVLDITRRKQVEKALDESRRMLQLVLDTIPVRVFWKDRESRYLGSNALLAHDTGYASPEELIGKTDYDTASRDMAERYRADDREVMNSGIAKVNYEEPQIAADGSQVWLRTSKIPLRDADGQIIGVLGAYEDITDRKRAEEALRAGEQRLAMVIETAVVGLVIHASDGKVVRSNSTAQELLGLSAEVMQGKSLADPAWHFIREDGTLTPIDEYPAARCLASGEHVRDLVLGIRSPQTPQTIWVLANAVPLLDTHGTVSEVIVTFTDITERKRAEQERERLLAEVNRRAAELDATISAIADGVIIYGKGLEILRINDTAERILEYSCNLIERPVEERLDDLQLQTTEGHPVTFAEFPAVRAVAGETVRNVVYSLIRHDGRKVWASISAAPLRMADSIMGAVLTFSDITAIHDLQQRQAEILRIVSHDLRLPLTVIKGHAQLIEGSLIARHLNGDLTRGINTIVRSVQRMDIMIQDLVDIARLEGKQLTLRCEPVELDSYLPDLLQSLSEILPVARVRLHLAPNIPPIRADYARLERMLLNLLSNALKFSAPEMPVDIHVTQQGQEVVIAVADHGQGISPEDLPHIFERFYPVKGARKVEGVGLGLYITKMLTEAHGGRIWVDSTIGKGSTFYLALPIASDTN